MTTRRVNTKPATSSAPVSSTPATPAATSEPIMTQPTSSVLTVDLNDPAQIAKLRELLGVKPPKTPKAEKPAREIKPWTSYFKGMMFLNVPVGWKGITADVPPPPAVFEVDCKDKNGKEYKGYYIARGQWKLFANKSGWGCVYQNATAEQLAAAGYTAQEIQSITTAREAAKAARAA